MSLYKPEDGVENANFVRVISIDHANALHDERCFSWAKIVAAKDAEIERLRGEVESLRRDRLDSYALTTERDQLRARVAELEAENEKIRAGWNEASERNIPLHTERIAVKADNARLREALAFYADGAPFCGDAKTGEDATFIDCACGTRHIVGGKRARAALAGRTDAADGGRRKGDSA